MYLNYFVTQGTKAYGLKTIKPKRRTKHYKHYSIPSEIYSLSLKKMVPQTHLLIKGSARFPTKEIQS